MPSNPVHDDSISHMQQEEGSKFCDDHVSITKDLPSRKSSSNNDRSCRYFLDSSEHPVGKNQNDNRPR